MDAVELRIYDSRIAEARFEGYCSGKKVMKQWAKNDAKMQRENPED